MIPDNWRPGYERVNHTPFATKKRRRYLFAGIATVGSLVALGLGTFIYGFTQGYQFSSINALEALGVFGGAEAVVYAIHGVKKHSHKKNDLTFV